MALKSEDVNEGADKEIASTPKEVTQVAVTESESIKELQKQVALLSEKLSGTSNSTDPGTLKQLVSAINGSKQDSSLFSFESNYTSEVMIDEEDILDRDDWVTFIAHTVGYVIVDDKINGIPVRVPFGKIEFRYDSTKTVKNGKEDNVYNISKYTCKSRKELAFLRKHSGFNFFFFDNIKGAKSVDSAKAIKMQTIFKSLSSLGQIELVSLAKQNGVPISDDIGSLRGQIAMKIVGNQDEKERSVTEQLLKETNLEAELLAR